MKTVSWNVNGFRAAYTKGFADYFGSSGADIFCVQETKMQRGDFDFSPKGYYSYWNYAEKKGYSGTAVFSRMKPLSASFGMGIKEHDAEGRIITLEFDDFYFVNVYVPNSQRELKRLDYRMEWDGDFRGYIKKLDDKKPVIACGDFNVAHKEIDLKNPSANRNNAGFTEQEREGFTRLLDAGFTDSFRFLYPDAKGAYTYWSYLYGARSRNAGWRIDYICMSRRLTDKLKSAAIHDDISGSDHCPISAEFSD
ncbi:MAG: exodeoxyribonuclease III [Christensenellales bacterium]